MGEPVPSFIEGESAQEREDRLIAAARSSQLTSEWCKHEPPCEFRSYPSDGECKCSVFKHHVHGACGGIIQIG